LGDTRESQPIPASRPPTGPADGGPNELSRPQFKQGWYETDGSERIQLSFPPLQVALPRWSRDGRQIVFMGRLPPQLWQIYVVPAEGGSPQQLVSDDDNEGAPDWSPSGSQLMFSQFPELGSAARGMVIHRLDLRTHQVSILPGSDGLYSAHWSSDGRYIAASTVDNSKLMASELATRKWTTVCQPGGRILGWSRNDEHIYYENNGTVSRECSS